MMPANASPFSYPYGAMNFMVALAIRIIIDNSYTRLRGIFKVLSQDGEWLGFSQNLPASLKINVIQMNLMSAVSFSLDSTFKSGQQRTPYASMLFKNYFYLT